MELLERIELFVERSNDRQQRRAARYVYDTLLDALKKKGKSLLTRGKGDILFLVPSDLKGVVGPSEWEPLKEVFQDIAVIFKHVKPSKASRVEAASYYYGRKYLVVNVVSKTLAGFEEKMDNPARQLNIARDSFVHEYIHHLDNLRTDGGVFSKDDDTPEEYANSDHEMNAHFQSGASAIEEMLLFKIDEAIQELKSDPGSDYAWDELRYALRPFDQRQVNRYFRVYFENAWTEHLSKENERKVKKRIYSLYDQIVDYAREELKDAGLYDEAVERGVIRR